MMRCENDKLPRTHQRRGPQRGGMNPNCDRVGTHVFYRLWLCPSHAAGYNAIMGHKWFERVSEVR